jgi:hypothetical protein
MKSGDTAYPRRVLGEGKRSNSSDNIGFINQLQSYAAAESGFRLTEMISDTRSSKQCSPQ